MFKPYKRQRLQLKGILKDVMGKEQIDRLIEFAGGCDIIQNITNSETLSKYIQEDKSYILINQDSRNATVYWLPTVKGCRFLGRGVGFYDTVPLTDYCIAYSTYTLLILPRLFLKLSEINYV